MPSRLLSRVKLRTDMRYATALYSVGSLFKSACSPPYLVCLINFQLPKERRAGELRSYAAYTTAVELNRDWLMPLPCVRQNLCGVTTVCHKVSSQLAPGGINYITGHNLNFTLGFISLFSLFWKHKTKGDSWDHLTMCIFPLALLGNGSTNVFPRQHATIEEMLDVVSSVLSMSYVVKGK